MVEEMQLGAPHQNEQQVMPLQMNPSYDMKNGRIFNS